jgi:hypothetical protein
MNPWAWTMVLFEVGTIVWVAVDASTLGVRRGVLGSGFFDQGVAGWFFACVIVWSGAFPAYLAMRPRYVERKRQASLPSSGGTVADELWRLAGLRNSGVLTQAEYDAQSAPLRDGRPF